MRTRLLIAALALCWMSTAAQAQIPGNPHVDPKAPCFRWPAVDMDEDGVFDRIDHCPGTPKGVTVDEYGCPTEASAVVMPPPPPPAAPPVATPPPAPPMREMERQLVEHGRIRLESVYFETASATLLPESETTLHEAGETLEKYPALVVEVQGHTDTRGSEAYNKRLSQLRAEAVRAFLLEHFRLEPDHLVAKGYGEEQPETREQNDEELLRNRRVELHVKNPDALPRGTKVER